MVDSPGYDSVKELHIYFTKILDKKKSVPCKANEVRSFVEQHAREMGDTKLATFVLYHTFCNLYPNLTIERPYFEDIVTKAWQSFVIDDTLHIDVSRPIISTKNMRRRRF